MYIYFVYIFLKFGDKVIDVHASILICLCRQVVECTSTSDFSIVVLMYLKDHYDTQMTAYYVRNACESLQILDIKCIQFN